MSLRPASLVVSLGRPTEPGSPLNVPIVPASNFVHGAGPGYARDDGTPTWHALEAIVGELEGGHAYAFSSGMAAVAAVFDAVPRGGSVVLPDDCYQGVVALAERGWRVRRVPVTDTAQWLTAARDADLLWLESPTNPLLMVADLPAICGAPRKGLLGVDNTLMTPLGQRPLTLGADVVIHSATKFIGGHSDLLGGLAIARGEALARELHRAREVNGATPGALECFLAVRGVRTLALRLAQARANARELARRLSAHPRVLRVRFVDECPLISFDVDGDAARAELVCERVRLVRHATSLGAVESTMERRAAVPGQEHLPPTLLRLSVGIEDVEDLWADLSQAIG